MESRSPTTRIGRIVRDLREDRAMTQRDLAQALGMSQGRLSEVERGAGSFSAEQFLEILRIFNVTVGRFLLSQASDPDEQLRGALARLGAFHLLEDPDTTPATTTDDPGDLIRQALVHPDPRLVTSLAPLLLLSMKRIALPRLFFDAAKIGLDLRIGWLCENTAVALEGELATRPSRAWAQAARHTLVVLRDFLTVAEPARASAASLEGAFWIDGAIRTEKSKQEVEGKMSSISRRWRQVTDLQPEHFAEALRSAREARS